jgi:sulfur-oxidizing protein SoxA
MRRASTILRRSGLVRAAFALATLPLVCGAQERGIPERRIPIDQLKSGITFSSPNIRSLQADDFANPGMLWVERGAKLWSEPAGSAGVSCERCHQQAEHSMKGAATHSPRIDPATHRLIDLAGQINACQVNRQRAEAFARETEPLLALSAYLGYQSRGLPIHVAIDGEARAYFEAGRKLYYRRMGQMNLACTHCHEQNWGRQLLAETISQGHGSAYPIYRLDWQTVGSLQRRFRSCLYGVRAELWPFGADEYLELELYLAWRAEGLAIETPGVRK